MLYAFANGFVTAKGLTKNPIKKSHKHCCMIFYILLCIILWAKTTHYSD